MITIFVLCLSPTLIILLSVIYETYIKNKYYKIEPFDSISGILTIIIAFIPVINYALAYLEIKNAITLKKALVKYGYIRKR